jgi:hypothetical protein
MKPIIYLYHVQQCMELSLQMWCFITHRKNFIQFLKKKTVKHKKAASYKIQTSCNFHTKLYFNLIHTKYKEKLRVHVTASVV